MDEVMEKLKRIRRGFTIIELLVVVGVLGILAAAVFAIVGPAEQAKKTRDAQRKSDLSQVRLAVEGYYEDYKRYPPSTEDFQIQSGNFGKPWQPYMVKVPQDPRSPTRTYVYMADSSGQSYQLYAYLEREEKDSQACKDGCGPNGEYFYGVTSPNVTVAKIEVTPTPIQSGPTPSPTPAGPTPTSPPGVTPTPTPIQSGPTPSPTPRPCGAEPATYFISHNDTPQFMQLDVAPELPCVGGTQTMTVAVRDTTSSPITSVSVILATDTQSNQYSLALTSGTNLNGKWSGTWTIQDSLNKTYQVKFQAANQAGKSSSVTLPFR